MNPEDQNLNFIEYAGKQIPTSYGDSLLEYKAAKNFVGIFDLSINGKIQISGKESSQFLNGILSNYVKPLPDNCGVYSLFLTPHGKVISDCYLYKIDGNFLIDLDAISYEKVFKQLQRLTFAGDFQVTDLTQTHALISLQGPNSGKLLEKVSGCNLNDWQNMATVAMANGKQETIAVAPIYKLNIGTAIVNATRRTRTQKSGYDLFITIDDLANCWEILNKQGIELGLRSASSNVLETLRIEAGIPRYGVDFDEETIALEAGLNTAISYNKGCFVGQETIAKIHWRGQDQVAKKLVRLTIDGDIVPASKTPILINEKQVGYTTSAIYSPQLGNVLSFGYIKTSAINDNSVFTIGTNQLNARIYKDLS